jgi:hypothetical protein
MNALTHLSGALCLLLLMVISGIPIALAQRNATSHGLPSNIIQVTNTNDSGPGSLRNALASANDGDMIDATGVSGIILLTSGELQINHNVTVNGPGAANLAVNGNAASRVFENFASNVTISGFTITNGHFPVGSPGGGIFNHGGLIVGDSSISANDGTGIYNGHNPSGGTLTVMNSSISANNGGGINSFGTLAVTNSTISNNLDGGGISAGGIVTISNSTINDNQKAGCYGGGLSVSGNVTVISSTISGNSLVGCPGCSCSGPFGGGGIAATDATVTIINSTISGNHADRSYDAGGGIYMIDMCPGSVTLINSTVSDNSSAVGAGGGGFAYECPDGGPAGTFVIENSTFSGNWAPNGGGIRNNGGVAQIGNTVFNAGVSGGTILGNVGAWTSLGYNLASDDGGGVLTGPGDQINTNPMLGPLQDNGGPTFTHALLPGSPAIDAGNPGFIPPPLYDQRGPGFDRVVNGRIDIGSFEVHAGSTPTPTLTPTPTATPTPTPTATATATPTSTPRPSVTPRPSQSPRPRPTPAPRP